MLRLLVAMLVLVSLSPVETPQAPEVPKGPSAHLKPLTFLIGKWEGSGEMPGLGKFKDEFVYEWGVNQQFLHAKYVAKSPTGELLWTDQGVMGWDAEKKKLVSFGFGMDGSIGRGEHVDSGKAGVWITEGKTSGGDETMKAWRVTMTKVDDNTLTTKMEVNREGQYTEFFTSKYRKVPAR